MATKTALIVDDSRTARMVLSRLLVEHGVDVDEVASAEAALEYLSRERPDVVFLDHMMPGMDGLEALESIKANPDTATIPVMMYTSQEGQLYLGQARALGAVGVLPKSMAPADVKRVLRSLHLVDDPEAEPAAVRSVPSPIDRRELTRLIQELLYEQTAMLRDEMRRHVERTHVPAPPPPEAVEPAPRRSTFALVRAQTARIATGLSLAVAIAFVYLYAQTDSMLASAHEQAARLAQDTIAVADASSVAAARSARADMGALETRAWRRHLSRNYAFGAVPLDDANALEFGTLFADLEESGFTGSVLIEIHAGRFCMNYDPNGDLELAPPDQPAATCEQIGMPDPAATAPNARQSVNFANMVASATRGGQLGIETISRGTVEPLIDYPPLGYSITAGDWNSIAASNQRITLRLAPATRDRDAN